METLIAGAIDTSRLVFVDEMGVSTSLCPLYACSQKGRRAYAEVPRNRGKGSRRAAHSTLFVAPRRSPVSANRSWSSRNRFDRYSDTASSISAPATKPTEILKTILLKTRSRPTRIYIGRDEYKHAAVHCGQVRLPTKATRTAKMHDKEAGPSRDPPLLYAAGSAL